MNDLATMGLESGQIRSHSIEYRRELSFALQDVGLGEIGEPEIGILAYKGTKKAQCKVIA